MAKLQEEVIVIKVSRLVRDDDDLVTMITSTMLTDIKSVIQELVDTGPGPSLVEITLK